MANSIDFGTLAIGALVGIGCRKQIKAASRVAMNLASSLATSAAVAVNSAAAEVSGQADAVGQSGQSTQAAGQKKGH